MDCKDVQHYLIDYMEGELAPGHIKALEEHVAGCKSCSSLLEEYQRMEAAIRAERMTEPNPFAATRILQYIENKQERRNRQALAVLRPVMITLALFLALTLGFLIGNHGISRAPAEASSNQEIEILKTNLFITDFVDEDLSMLSNQ